MNLVNPFGQGIAEILCDCVTMMPHRLMLIEILGGLAEAVAASPR